jgi:hypothetical protein
MTFFFGVLLGCLVTTVTVFIVAADENNPDDYDY